MRRIEVFLCVCVSSWTNPESFHRLVTPFRYFLGDTLHLSDIDMIDGTPVLDVKPYIPEYDSPNTRTAPDLEQSESSPDLPTLSEKKEMSILNFALEDKTPENEEKEEKQEAGGSLPASQTPSFLPKQTASLLKEVESFVNKDDPSPPDCRRKNHISGCEKNEPPALVVDRPHNGADSSATIADWIREPPVSSLDVRFTPHAQKQLEEFLPAHLSGKATAKGWCAVPPQEGATDWL